MFFCSLVKPPTMTTTTTAETKWPVKDCVLPVAVSVTLDRLKDGVYTEEKGIVKELRGHRNAKGESAVSLWVRVFGRWLVFKDAMRFSKDDDNGWGSFPVQRISVDGYVYGPDRVQLAILLALARTMMY